MALVEIKDLTIKIKDGGPLILDRVSLNIPQGKILGLVGGSGSGKTTLGMAMLKLLPSAMHVSGGSIMFNGKNIAAFDEVQMRDIRGKHIGMVFQEPLSAFDPLFTIGQHLEETLCAHASMNPSVRTKRINEVLRSVEISEHERIRDSYPHELSGGLRQRAMIAQAIICHPQLIIADEATSSLDVTIQAKIMRLLKRLIQENGMSILLISHDIGMVGHLADEIAVMTEGRIVEHAKAQEIMRRPNHAYTKSLVEAY